MHLEYAKRARKIGDKAHQKISLRPKLEALKCTSGHEVRRV
jgi:hypothetical protein